MKFPAWLRVFGDQSYRGHCSPEEDEQKNIFAEMKTNRPLMYKMSVHPKNGAKRGIRQISKDKAIGALNKGASDIICPLGLPMVCEIKRKDHTRSHWQDKQIEYLEEAQKSGAFVCVVLGLEGFKEAASEYYKLLEVHHEKTSN